MMNDLEAKIVQHDEQIKTLFSSQARLEKVVDKIDKLTVSIEKMTVVQQDMIDEQKAIKQDVAKIKEQPAKDAHALKMTITSCIVTGIISVVLGAILTLVIRG